jgi:hypothetical protein
MNISRYIPELNYEDPSIKGIFSFSLYSPSKQIDRLDNAINWVEIKNEKIEPINSPALYIYGISSYLCLLTYPEWKGWKVVIHTDNRSFTNNPKTFDYFMKHGAVIGIVDDTSIGRSSLHEPQAPAMGGAGGGAGGDAGGVGSRFINDAVIRVSRYTPFFYSDAPVFVRDADTIFDRLITAILRSNLILKGTGFFRKEKIPVVPSRFAPERAIPLKENDEELTAPEVSIFAIPTDPFPIHLSRWEQYCLQKVNEYKERNGTTFYIGIDENYQYTKKLFNTLFNSINDVPKPLNINVDPTKPSSGRVRGFAGFVCSLEKLPMAALEMFPKLLGMITDPIYFTMIDEIYLSYFLYRFMKAQKKLGFIVIRYTNSDLPYIGKEKLIELFGGNEIKPLTKYVLNSMEKGGGFINVDEYYNSRHLRQFLYLLHPEFHLRDEAFYNPLKLTKKVKNSYYKYPINVTFRKQSRIRRKTWRSSRRASRKHS